MRELLQLVQGVLADLHPQRLLPARLHIAHDRVEVDGLTVGLDGVAKVAVLGLGKASVAQVDAVRSAFAVALGDERVAGPGFAVTKTGNAAAGASCDVLEASHPVPDAGSRAAASELSWRARSVPPEDLLVVCVSGGGSSLAVAPRDPFRLAEKRQANAELLASGASIDETNLIRREMSAFKNGGLLAASNARRVLTLVTSDVPVPDLAVVASGPTVYRPLDPDRVVAVARERLSRVLARRIEGQLYGQQRRAWNAHLAAAAAEHASFVACVGDWPALADACSRRLRAAGVEHVRVRTEPFDEPIASGVRAHVLELEGLSTELRPWALVTGGELPVRVRGDGRGGRNTEFVLRMARALWIDREGVIPHTVRDRLAVLAVGTDGSDGPTDAAGGWLTKRKLEDAHARGLSLDAALDDSDSLTFLEQLGCAIRTGPTHTNLMDLRLVVP